ncbi:MAG: type II toxin-antitoxin system VapC family toxin [Deferribacteraceae bacterium]|jgi:tRNA(fMet)-specific endonuclease VapC|nr:type II toxin-antitoxin system VapC family toxin [Deferribacteraceae bacterium]
MTYLFDINICTKLINNKSDFSERIRERFINLHSNNLCISSITCAGLYLCAIKSSDARKKVDLFLNPFDIIDFDECAAIEYSKIIGSLDQRNKDISMLDSMLAAQAVSRGYTLVSDMHSFKQISPLKLEIWA